MTSGEKNRIILFHDDIADDYDSILSKNPFSEILRSLFHKILLNNILQQSHVLDIGCGTGEDALFLAKNGISVTAVDISSKMIGIAVNKALKEGCNSKIQFICDDMESFISNNRTKFDAIISNFNAVNYVKDVSGFSGFLSASLNSNGKLILTVLNKLSISEVIYNLLRLKINRSWKAIFKRKELLITDLNLFFPGTLSGFFKDEFKIQKITGIGILIPPHNLTGMYHKLGFGISVLLGLERLIASFFPFYSLSDHYIIEMQKK